MFKTSIKLSFVSLILLGSAQAQEVFKLNSSGGGFNVMVGYQGFDGSDYFKNGNSSLAGGEIVEEKFGPDDQPEMLTRARYTQPSGGVITTGFQGYGVFNSFMIGGELNSLYGSSTSGTQKDSIYVSGAVKNSGNTARFAGGDVLLNVGFVALRKRGLVVYPMLGLGYGASGLWLQSKSDSRTYPEAASIVTDADNNLQNMFIWTRNTVLDFGIGAQYMLGASTEDRAKGFSLGIRLGYKTQLGTDNILINANKNAKDSFTADELREAPLPTLGYSGAYIKLLIGFGRIGESR